MQICSCLVTTCNGCAKKIELLTVRQDVALEWLLRSVMFQKNENVLIYKKKKRSKIFRAGCSKIRIRKTKGVQLVILSIKYNIHAQDHIVQLM